MKLFFIAACVVSLPMTFVHSSHLEDDAMDKYEMYRSFAEKEGLSDEAGACEVNFEKVGCFKDKKKQRALPELLFNDRKNISWEPGKWEAFLKRLACRCAQASKAMGRGYFGLQFYGECFTGPEAEATYDQHGRSSRCVGYNYSRCNDSNSEECVGKGNTNYVYRIAEGSGSGSGSGPLFLS